MTNDAHTHTHTHGYKTLKGRRIKGNVGLKIKERGQSHEVME